MAKIDTLTTNMVREWFDSGTYQRGSAYFRNGHIIDTTRHGDVLHAKCIGSEIEPYELEAALNRDGLSSAWCSCPIGQDGDCKHVVALLLTWINHPDRFLAVENLPAMLQSLPRDELVLLAYLMLARRPELLVLLQIPFLQLGARPALDSATMTEIIAQTFDATTTAEWESYDGPPENLVLVIALAAYRLQSGDWESAELILRLVCQKAMARPINFDAPSGIASLITACLPGLTSCLEIAVRGPVRHGIVALLMEVLAWDTRHGYGHLAARAGEVLAEHATADERRRLTAWAKEQFELDDETWRARYARRAYGDLLLTLGGGDLDDETYLEICRARGQTNLLIERLLSLGRIEQALEQVPFHSHILYEVADAFFNSGHTQEFEELLLAEDRRRESFAYTDWLRRRAEQRGDPERALELAVQVLWMSPTIECLLDVKRLAQELDQWGAMRTGVLDRLAGEGRHVLLTEIYLDEGDAGMALATLDQVLPTAESWRVHDLRLRAAAQGEETHPQEALILYAEEVETLIAARGRANYATAAEYLARMKTIYTRLDLEEAWEEFIQGLRTDNDRLWALREEMQKAGL